MTASQIFASMLVNASIWIQDQERTHSEYQISNVSVDIIIIWWAKTKQQYGFIHYNIPVFDHTKIGETIEFQPTKQWCNRSDQMLFLIIKEQEYL